mmetsp:Transcript_30459/g.45446  ORF Transcript_30459/g.45446 Transcript_30459/m.45446 type:complete len:408 (+) Transcript_30459:59-1282(+)
MRNTTGNSSTSTMSSQQKRRPLHLMGEIETMMNQKSQQDTKNGNRNISAAGVDDAATYSSRTAAAVLSSNASGGDGRKPRQRRHYKRGDNDSNITGDCSTSASSLSFLHSHRGASSRVGGNRSSVLKKDSLVYGGLFVLCGIMSYTIFMMDGFSYHHHYSYDLAAAATSSSSNATWSSNVLSNHSHNISSTIAERRSTLTSVESTQVATPPQLPFLIGNHKTPVTKWYMKVKPTEMKADSGRIKPKVLPQELIRRHHQIAFIGIMHDNLSKAFVNILAENPQHRWDQVFVLFPSDSCLRNTLVQNYQMQPVEKLIENKNACRASLHELLSPVVRDLRFLTYDQLMHCGSYWDWRDPGGFIHVSPLTWGANPKTCPAMNYYWNSKVPSPEYRVYRDGLGYLLKVATPF